MQVRAKKSLGQHFLTDLNIAERIAATLDGHRNQPTLEVGPGMGVLTEFLLDRGHDLTVVELDQESVRYLQLNFPKLDGRIVAEDFLKLDLRQIYGDRTFSIIGNYPYNISSQIFFKVIDNRELIPCCTGMIQHEVALRMASQPGTKAYGILSVLIQAWYDVEYLFMVDETVFNPPPKVKSAVIRMTRNQTQHLGCDEQLFKRVVKTVFNQRRKMLRVSLKQLLPSSALAAPDSPLADHPFMTLRPEQLTIPQFVELTNMVEKVLCSDTNTVCSRTNA